MVSSSLLCAVLCACMLPCCAKFGDRQGDVTSLRDFARQFRSFAAAKKLPCFVTVQSSVDGRLGDELFRYASCFGIARRTGCAWCPPAALLSRLAAAGFQSASADAACSRMPHKGHTLQVDDFHAVSFAHVDQVAQAAAAEGQHVLLRGNLQSHRNFDEHIEGLRRALVFAPHTMRECKSKGAVPPGSGKLVTIHIRGDKDGTQLGIATDADFYVDAVRTVVNATKSIVTVHIVTESPNWVRQHVLPRLQILTSNRAMLVRGSKASVDMCIAAQGQVIVISGGTFSFFCALLGNANATVMYDPTKFRWDLYRVVGKAVLGNAALSSFYPPQWLAWAGMPGSTSEAMRSELDALLPHGLAYSSTIEIRGIYDAKDLNVWIYADTAEKAVMYHLSARSSENNVVFNTRIGKEQWGEEERIVPGCCPLPKLPCPCEAAKFPFVRNRAFVVQLHTAKQGVKLVIDGKLQPTFAYRSTMDITMDGSTAIRIVVKGRLSKLAVHGEPATRLPYRISSLGEEETGVVPAILRGVALPLGWQSGRVPPAKRLRLFVGILSGPTSLSLRQAARKSWMQQACFKSGECAARFFIGNYSSSAHGASDAVNARIAREAARYGDIHHMPDVKDCYLCIAHKSAQIMVVGAAVADFTLKCDDDTLVRLDRVLPELAKHRSTDAWAWARFSHNSPIHREVRNKWYMPWREFPGTVYPPFPHGPAYIFTNALAAWVRKRHKAGTLKVLRLEDVSAGVWLDQAKTELGPVKLQSSTSFVLTGCEPAGIIAHYLKPKEMICLGQHLLAGAPNMCVGCSYKQ